MNKVKVFIVENSVLMQRAISEILSSDPLIEVIGYSQLGKEALEKIPQLRPDIVTLDMHLPDMDGLAIIKELVRKFPIRILIISAYTQNGADLTLRALEAGALDFVSKPSGEISLNLHNFKDEIISKIKLIINIDLNKAINISKKIVPIKETLLLNKIVVIGASTGGPKAIQEILREVPFDTEAGFLIVQHMPKGFTKTFAQRLSCYSNIRVKESETGDLISQGSGFIGCAGFQMLIERLPKESNQYRIRLDENPAIHLKPCLDVTMESVAEEFCGKIIGVILTGMGKDGLEGAKKIKEKGGKIIVQDETSCVVYGMPKSIIDAELADEILSLNEIPKKIGEYLANG